MDRKSIIILAAAILLLFGLSPLVDHFFPPKMVEVTATNQVSSVTNAAVGSNHLAHVANPVPAPTPAPAPSTAPPTSQTTAPLPTEPEAPEQTLAVSNAEVVYHFTSRGGGIQRIDLLQYPAVTRRSVETKAPNRPATLNDGAPVPIGDDIGGGLPPKANFTLTRSGNVVRAECDLPNGIRFVKEYDFGTDYAFKAHDLAAETNHLFTLRLFYQNTTRQPVALPARELVVGASTPSSPLDDSSYLGVYWFNQTKAQNITISWFANRYLIFLHGPPRSEYRDGAGNVAWVAPHNQFFAVAAIPKSPASQVVMEQVETPEPDTNGLPAPPRVLLTNAMQTALVFGATNLAPGQTFQKTVTFYAGPKEYNVLGKLGQEMGNNLDAIMDFGGPSGFFSKGLLVCMNGLHALGFGYGMCIIAITVIIKLVFWPLTAAAARSQKRLQALQPQLKAIADKYKDDAAKKNEKTMEFMKQNKVNPMGSCIPSLVQIPVFFGFYYMLRSAIELRGVHFLWAYDLSQPDTVAYIGGFPINPLPLIMGVTQFWQMHTTPPSPGMDEGQQKIMKLMPLMFLVFFYRMSSGLTLYWTISNLLSVLQMKTTRAAVAAETTATRAPTAPVRKKK